MIPVAEGLAFVVRGLALGQTDLDFHLSVFEIHLERDEGEREAPCDLYPWDGVSGVRPYRALAATTTIGVY
jgi:hypothetical protein